jgi:microcystin-dependent protein
MHVGPSFPQGQTTGEQTHTLLLSEIPMHTHLIGTSSKAADLASPGNNMQFATYTTNQYFSEGNSNLQPMNPNNVGSAGGSQPHPNMQPYLALNFCIALSGIFPSRT